MLCNSFLSRDSSLSVPRCSADSSPPCPLCATVTSLTVRLCGTFQSGFTFCSLNTGKVFKSKCSLNNMFLSK